MNSISFRRRDFPSPPTSTTMQSDNPFVKLDRRINNLDRRLLRYERRRAVTAVKLNKTQFQFKICLLGTLTAVAIFTVYVSLMGI